VGTLLARSVALTKVSNDRLTSDCRLQIDLKGQIPVNNQDVQMESDGDEAPLRVKHIDKIFIIDHHFALN
jgi:hypothetical protein